MKSFVSLIYLKLEFSLVLRDDFKKNGLFSDIDLFSFYTHPPPPKDDIWQKWLILGKFTTHPPWRNNDIFLKKRCLDMIFQQLNFNDKGVVKKTSRLFQSPQNAQTFLGSKIFSPNFLTLAGLGELFRTKFFTLFPKPSLWILWRLREHNCVKSLAFTNMHITLLLMWHPCLMRQLCLRHRHLMW